MGRLRSGMRVSASFQIIPRPVGRLGLEFVSVRVRTPSRETVRVKCICRLADSGGGMGNVLHHAKSKEELSVTGSVGGNMFRGMSYF